MNGCSGIILQFKRQRLTLSLVGILKWGLGGLALNGQGMKIPKNPMGSPQALIPLTLVVPSDQAEVIQVGHFTPVYRLDVLDAVARHGGDVNLDPLIHTPWWVWKQMANFLTLIQQGFVLLTSTRPLRVVRSSRSIIT